MTDLLARPGLGITVDAWDPGYTAAVASEVLGEPATSSAQLDLDVEVPADRWRPLDPDPSAASPSCLLIADGVRRTDARVWVDDPDGGAPAAGIAASYAAGLVRCGATDGSPAELAAVEVARGLFSASAREPSLATRHGVYPYERARDGSVEELSLALQRRLLALEAAMSERYRGQAGREDDLLLVDGPLRGRDHLPRTVGYVKTHHKAYLTGPHAATVSALRPGQRTPVFTMGTNWSRHSWYLRLPTTSPAPWSGVVRLEAAPTLAPDEVVALADTTARLLPALAGVAYKDPRAPQNLTPIRGLEAHLRHHLGDPDLLYRALRTAAETRSLPR